MSEVSRARAERDARALARLNTVVDGLWMLDPTKIAQDFRAQYFTPYDPTSTQVHERAIGFCALAGNIIVDVEEVLVALDPKLVGLHMHQLTVQATRWVDDLFSEIAPVEVPLEVQTALVAGATYQLALRKAGKEHVELDSVVQHVWDLSFAQVQRGVAARMEQ